jgi:hypothetical protein
MTRATKKKSAPMNAIMKEGLYPNSKAIDGGGPPNGLLVAIGAGAVEGLDAIVGKLYV